MNLRLFMAIFEEALHKIYCCFKAQLVLCIRLQFKDSNNNKSISGMTQKPQSSSFLRMKMVKRSTFQRAKLMKTYQLSLMRKAIFRKMERS